MPLDGWAGAGTQLAAMVCSYGYVPDNGHPTSPWIEGPPPRRAVSTMGNGHLGLCQVLSHMAPGDAFFLD